MRIPVALLPAGLAAALTACASPAPPPPPPPPPPVHTSLGLDGLYRPTLGGVHSAAACHPRALRVPIRVANGVARFQTAPRDWLEGRVAPDGSLMIEDGRSTLRGQFSGDWFHGSYTRIHCTFFLDYKK